MSNGPFWPPSLTLCVSVHMRQYAYQILEPAPLARRRRTVTISPLDKWYGFIKSHDPAALWDLLHPDAVFESPVEHTPQRGRDITFKYLVSAEQVLGGEGFAMSASGAATAARCSNSKRPSTASPSTASISSNSMT